MMNRILILVVTVFLAFPQIVLADLDGKENWKKYQVNATVFGLTPGKTKMREVLDFFGAGEIIYSHKKHEGADLCYKSSDASVYLIFGTGQKNDFATLYSIDILNKVDESKYKACHTTNKINPEISTQGGLRLGTSKRKVLDILGPEEKKDESGKKLSWNYIYVEVYEKPYIYRSPSYRNTGCTEEYIEKASRNWGFLTAIFEKEKLAHLEVWYSGEPEIFESKEVCENK